MIQKGFLIFISVYLLYACSSEKTKTIQAPKGKQILAGQIKRAANQVVSVRIFDGVSMHNSIDTTLDENGKFHIIIEDTNLIICQIIVNKTAVLPVVLTGNDSLYFKASFPDLLSNVAIKNCTYAPELIDYLSQMHDFLKYQDSTIKANGNINRNDTEKINAIRTVLLSKKKVVEHYVQQYIEKNPASPVNMLLAQELYPTNGMEFWDTTYLATLTTMYDAFLENYPNEKYTATLLTQIQSWKSSLEEYKVFKQKSAIYGGKHFKIAVGEEAPDIQMKNPDGKIIKLSSLKGKYVLVDFWASWCGPCRKENPNVVRLYNKYKNKGFTIFSVSLDKKYDDWIKAIKQDQLSWKNHVCDFDGWDSFIAKIYNVSSIPFTVLLDKSGKIIALNLRGQQLEQKLMSLLEN